MKFSYFILIMAVFFMKEINGEEKGLIVNVENTCTDTILKCKDNAVFTVKAENNGQLLNKGKCTVTLSNDGGNVFSKREYELADGNPFKVSGTIDFPGFLRCEASVEKKSDMSTAAFEPEKIKAALPCPEDFDAFWETCVRRQDAIPSPVELIPLPQYGDEKSEAFKIVVSTLDNEKIYGYMTIPKKEGKFPVIVHVPGASKLKNRPEKTWVDKGAIYVIMNVHRLDPSEDARIAAEQKKAIKPLRYAGLPDREKYYYRNSILAVNAVINYMASYPRWDGKHLVFKGASQGGGFALFMGGLNRRLTAVVSEISALCDHGGHLAGRSAGWPLLHLQEGFNPDEVMKMSGYFDGVNFAKRIKAPLMMCVGFKDTTCCPSSVYAAYNAAPGEKEIINDVKVGHRVSREAAMRISEWLEKKFNSK